MLNRMRDLLSLVYIRRWNVVPLTMPQSVAEHSFRAVVIGMEIVDRLRLSSESMVTVSLERVMRWLIVHDGAECLTGDLPSQFKQFLSEFDLDDIECRLCPWLEAEQGLTTVPEETIGKLADTLEAISWLAVHGQGSGAKRIQASLEERAQKLADEAKVISGLESILHITEDLMVQLKRGELPVIVDARDVPGREQTNDKQMGVVGGH